MPDPATYNVHKPDTRADADRKKSATKPQVSRTNKAVKNNFAMIPESDLSQPPEQKFRPGMKLLKENEHGIFEFVVYVVSGKYDEGKKEWMYELTDWKKEEMSGETPEGSLEEC